MGIIGARVAERLRSQGKKVYVWNRTPRTIPNFLGSPAEVAQVARVIQIFLRDDTSLDSVMNELESALTSHHIVLNHTTVSPTATRRAAQRVEAKGARFLDAPFTGSKQAAAAGKLVYYIGGETKTLEKARSILEASSQNIIAVGEIGEATVLKIATNMLAAASVEILAEAMALVKSEGVALEKFQKAVEVNATRSVLTDMKTPTMIAKNFETHFSLQNMDKDARYALEMARVRGLDLPALAAIQSALERGVEQGRGELDYSAVALNYEGGSRPASP